MIFFVLLLYIWLGKHFEMTLKHNISWEHVEPFDGNRRIPKCKYCGKIIHGSITRLKQHIARISGQVQGYSSVPAKVAQNIKLYMSNVSNEKIQMKKKNNDL